MSVDRFLQKKSEIGKLDSEGQFTIDLNQSAEKLAHFALPSRHHFLLRMVQLAHILEAEDVRVKIGRTATYVAFLSHGGEHLCNVQEICAALLAPLEVDDPALSTLASALLGTLTQKNLRTVWSYVHPEGRGQLEIDPDRRVRSEQNSPLLNEEVTFQSFRLAVVHQSSWKFWKDAGRRAESASLLQQFCQFSACRIFLDGRELPAPSVWRLNEHIRPPQLYKSGVSTSRKRVRVAADNILMELAGPEEDAFTLLRPSLNSYVVRRDHYNLWVWATRPSNTLLPDGESSVSWMLQFRSKGKNMSMRRVRKRERFRAALVLNQDESVASANPRIIVLRYGVTVFDQVLVSPEPYLEPFQGCCLIFADSELEMDISGLRLVHDESFEMAVSRLSSLVEDAKEFFQDGLDLIHYQAH